MIKPEAQLSGPPAWVFMPKYSGLLEHILETEGHTKCGCLEDSMLANLVPEDGPEDYKQYKIPLFKLKKIVRLWEEINQSGTVLDYRCPVCQQCTECTKAGKLHNRSVREEEEQDLIENSIFMDYANKMVTVKLPFIRPPEELCIQWGA
jgi:hypothetical protein